MKQIEQTLLLDKFKAREFQKPLMDALLKRHCKRLLAIWPRRCLSGDSTIIMSNGSHKLLRDIKVGDRVLSWDGRKFVSDKVKNVWSTGLKDTKRILCKGLPDLVASEDHRFATTTSSSYEIGWKSVGKFKNSTQLLQYAGHNNRGAADPDMAELLGYLYTDGYVSGYQQPKFTNNNIEILKRVEELIKSMYGYQVVWREKGNGFDLGITNGTKGGGATPNNLKNLFRAEGQDVPKSQKRFLSILWTFSNPSLLRFFAAVISGDGCLSLGRERRA